MKIVIIGSGGRLGSALLREYGKRFEVVGFNHGELDLSDENQIHAALDDLDFDVLINAAAFTNVDLCEKEPEMAMKINGAAPRMLAGIASQRNARIIHFSTDYVFDGNKREPYTEEDKADPISVYGKSKLWGESEILDVAGARGLIVRVSWVFGPDRPSFVDAVVRRAAETDKVDAIADKFATPTYTEDVVEMLPHFFETNVAGGVLHFANSGECSWQEYGQWAVDCCREGGLELKATGVRPLKLSEMKNFVARRPVYSVLSTGKYTGLTGITPRTWREAVAYYIMNFHLKR